MGRIWFGESYSSHVFNGDLMKDLKAKAAERAFWKIKCGHDLIIDIIQQIRNKYTDGGALDIEIEDRFLDANNDIMEGKDWLRALSDEES